MTYHEITVATLAGFLYGPTIWFLNDFSVALKKGGTGYFQTCTLNMNILYACYAYYYIMKAHKRVFVAEAEEATGTVWKLGIPSLVYFGFLFPSLVVYPTEAACAVFVGPSIHWLDRILFSHPAMVCILMLFETVGLQERLREAF